jgi:RHS repeat-associated protein
VGAAYYIGRPKTVNTSTVIYTGDTCTSGEIYTYTGTNLTKTEKTGNGTYAIVEDMTYDTVGNLLTKTVSAPAAPIAIAARTITDEYDTTKRFVIKKTDHQGFVTNFVYNTLGQVTKSTNYLGVISDFVFDSWGKLTQTTTTNVSATPLVTTISYAKLADGGYTTTSTNNTAAKSITQYDVLGRAVISTTKGFAVNSLISKQLVYDGLGRKLKESEPYFSAPSKWTSYEYDYLQRPTKVTASTGRIQTLSYSGLTTTSNDDGKTTTATVDALGNKTQTTDPGGTISFTYYANGQLKESNYEGHKVTIAIDGWGNKTAMNDPNAGTYTYAYDAFGQIINETTPKGATTNTYDNYGKLTKKKILGDGADYETDYAYNSFAQLTSETSKKAIGTPIDSFTYGFDSLHRLNTTTESNPSFSQTKTIVYDAYGRVVTATNATQELTTGLSSSVTTKNNYNAYNGIMDKMIDANDAVLWQLTGANEKMQSLTEALGNGVAITNAYSADNYFTSQKHAKNGINVLYNTYDFNSVKGTLNRRQNLALGMNETFGYDNLDRLVKWGNQSEVIWNCPFVSGTEGFEYTGEIGSVVNYTGKLKVTAQEAYYGTEKQLLSNVNVGKEINIKFDFTKVSGNTNIIAAVVERNPTNYSEIEYVLGVMSAATFETDYTVQQYQNVYLKFYLEEVDGYALPVNKSTTARIIDGDPVDIIPKAVFYIDNLVVNNLTVSSQTYDAKGRITKNNIGTYNYNTDLTTGIYKKKSISLDTEGNNYYTNLTKQTVTYTMFKSPITINESEKGATSFVYNSHLSRQTMTYGYQMPSGVYTKTKHYTDDGSVEILKTPTTITIRTYIGGDAYTAPLYVEKTKTIATGVIVDKKYYLHRDYLGSVIAISNDTGVAVERRQFDAWGNLAKLEQNGIAIALPANGTGAGLMMLDRGYTSHEHLAEVGLIQMNGRLYDPVLRTFLMPDNFIQQPENTQNYNRYAYVLNNPLMYTDPSGEIIPFLVAVAIGAAIAATTYTLTALLADVPFTVGGLAKATFIGAASAAVTFGIGSAAGNMFTHWVSSSWQQVARGAFQAIAHGTFQGGMTAISGGKFWSGFAAGALSSIASSAFSFDGNGTVQGKGWASSVRESGAGMIAFGTVSGGAGAALTGGNFWQGAVTGLVVSGLNHAFHQQPDPNKEMAKRLAKQYGGNASEIREWLNNHPFVVNEGVVSFEGIDGLSYDTNASNGNAPVMNKAFDKGFQMALKKGATYLIKKVVSGGGMLLNDGGLGKEPSPNNPNGFTPMGVANAQKSLLYYVFRPQGPMQNPSMSNGFNPYSGYSRFDTFYKVK